MTWLRVDTVYKKFPLNLRRPDYQDVWSYRKKFPVLYYVTQSLEKVTPNGQPEYHYNETLTAFDAAMCQLLPDPETGIIFLVATFGGLRHYYYYVSDAAAMEPLIAEIKTQFPGNAVAITTKPDKKWAFLRNYPVKLYPSG